MPRVYIPPIGARVKLRTLADYTSRNLPTWCWFEVGTTFADESAELLIMYGDKPADPERYVSVPMTAIEAPIGWKSEGYTITVNSAEKQTEVFNWIAAGRGITVRQSHYMPSCPVCFQPADNDGVPNWQFAGDTVVERIAAQDVKNLVRVVRLYQETDIGVPAKCPYCVDGKRTKENNPVLIGQDTETCPHCGVIAGFSFDKPYHARSTDYVGNPTDGQCNNVRPPAECWVCNGTGKGKTYLSELSKKDRVRVVAEMRADGWTVGYDRHNRMWWREKEVEVKRFGQDISEVAAEVKS